MDSVGVAGQFTCNEEADDGNGSTGIKEERIHPQLDLLHHLGI